MTLDASVASQAGNSCEVRGSDTWRRLAGGGNDLTIPRLADWVRKDDHDVMFRKLPHLDHVIKHLLDKSVALQTDS